MNLKEETSHRDDLGKLKDKREKAGYTSESDQRAVGIELLNEDDVEMEAPCIVRPVARLKNDLFFFGIYVGR